MTFSLSLSFPLPIYLLKRHHLCNMCSLELITVHHTFQLFFNNEWLKIIYGREITRWKKKILECIWLTVYRNHYQYLLRYNNFFNVVRSSKLTQFLSNTTYSIPIKTIISYLKNTIQSIWFLSAMCYNAKVLAVFVFLYQETIAPIIKTELPFPAQIKVLIFSFHKFA